jgi:hypothetical protein
MTDVIMSIARKVASSIWDGVQDVFSTASGALIAVVVAILLSIVPTFILVIAAIALFAGIVWSQYKEVLDTDEE